CRQEDSRLPRVSLPSGREEVSDGLTHVPEGQNIALCEIRWSAPLSLSARRHAGSSHRPSGRAVLGAQRRGSVVGDQGYGGRRRGTTGGGSPRVLGGDRLDTNRR